MPQVTSRLCCGAVSLTVILLSSGAVSATRDAATLCDDAARWAAQQTGVPLAVLQAISLAETGRQTRGGFQPWPWAVNSGGKGAWFNTAQEALEFAADRLAVGERNFDLGCFQINHRWHGDAFHSVSEMIDPDRNALYAAQFLAGLYDDLQDWPAAAAAYHSRTPEFADLYRQRFETILAGLPDAPPLPVTADEPALRPNLFPLLRAGARGSAGSLVPLQTSTRRLIGQP